jgi:hypothetical protein
MGEPVLLLSTERFGAIEKEEDKPAPHQLSSSFN